jgi:ABC-type ATPase involved in cell division
MIKFDNVSKRYAGGHEALAAISFEINKGEMAFITGRSGAGKSSLLKLILSMERHQYQSIFPSTNSATPTADWSSISRSPTAFRQNRIRQRRTAAGNLWLSTSGCAPSSARCPG